MTLLHVFCLCSPARAEADRKKKTEKKKKAVFCVEPAASRPVGCQNVWGPSGRQASGPGPPLMACYESTGWMATGGQRWVGTRAVQAQGTEVSTFPPVLF